MTLSLSARVIATESALALLASLRARYGPLMLIQAGCCSSSFPSCYALGEYGLESSDVYLGNLDGTPFYVEIEQFDNCGGMQLIIDAVSGTGAKDSLDCGTGMRFSTRTRLIPDN